jgi:hypothetical protein
MCRSRRYARRCRGIWRRQEKKLQRETARLSPEVDLRERQSDDRVEGEVGRFGFTPYEACDRAGEVVGRGDVWFPQRQPREWYKTEGFREEALCLEASRRS